MVKIIDGSTGEGGGSIIRFSTAFAALLSESINLTNIRVNRPKAGLRAQHLIGIKIINEIYDGELIGAHLGSTEFKFHSKNKEVVKNNVQMNIPTAGSIGLIFQALQLAFCQTQHEITVNITGGATYGAWAPTIEYIQNVTIPSLRLFGFETKIEVEKHGFYPKGGAKVKLSFFPPSQKKMLNLESQTKLDKIKGVSIASKFLENSNVADRIAISTEKTILMSFPEMNIDIRSLYVDSISPGCGLTLWTDHAQIPFGTSIVGKKGLSSEKLGKIGATNLVNDWENGGVIDKNLTDQIIPALGLSVPCKILTGPISSHTRTNIAITEKFLPVKFIITPMESKLNIISSKYSN